MVLSQSLHCSAKLNGNLRWISMPQQDLLTLHAIIGGLGAAWQLCPTCTSCLLFLNIASHINISLLQSPSSAAHPWVRRR
jgi:hypothetical protein